MDEQRETPSPDDGSTVTIYESHGVGVVSAPTEVTCPICYGTMETLEDQSETMMKLGAGFTGYECNECGRVVYAMNKENYGPRRNKTQWWQKEGDRHE